MGVTTRVVFQDAEHVASRIDLGGYHYVLTIDVPREKPLRGREGGDTQRLCELVCIHDRLVSFRGNCPVNLMVRLLRLGADSATGAPTRRQSDPPGDTETPRASERATDAPESCGEAPRSATVQTLPTPPRKRP